MTFCIQPQRSSFAFFSSLFLPPPPLYFHTLPFPLQELIHIPWSPYVPSSFASEYSHSLNLHSDMHSPRIPPDAASLVSFNNVHLQEVINKTNVSVSTLLPSEQLH
jgi:hypothetical protein